MIFVDINECSSLNGRCDHICDNTDGGHECSCRDGYQLLDDGNTCESKKNI